MLFRVMSYISSIYGTGRRQQKREKVGGRWSGRPWSENGRKRRRRRSINVHTYKYQYWKQRVVNQGSYRPVTTPRCMQISTRQTTNKFQRLRIVTLFFSNNTTEFFSQHTAAMSSLQTLVCVFEGRIGLIHLKLRAMSLYSTFGQAVSV